MPQKSRQNAARTQQKTPQNAPKKGQQSPAVVPQAPRETAPAAVPQAPRETPITTAEPIINTSETIQPVLRPHYPEWPTSKPGPRVKTAPAGMKPINARRPEQVAEIGYNQESGDPLTDSPSRSLPDATENGPTAFDQPTAQEVLGKRKKRL